MIPPEYALVIGVFVFYLYDALISFYGNEILLEGAGSHWKVISRTGWLAGGRYLHVPNPLAPYRMVFKGAWPVAPLPQVPAFSRKRAKVFARSMAPLQWLTALLAVQLLLGLPLLVLLERRDLLVGLAGTIYLSAALAASALFYRRRAFGLSKRACWSIAFDLMCCPPFAINAVRKVSLKRPARDLVVFAQASPDPSLSAQLVRATSEREVMLDGPCEPIQDKNTYEATPND